MMLTIGVILFCFLSQNLQNFQNLLQLGKVANRLLSCGEAVAEPHPFVIGVLHCFESFVINYPAKVVFFPMQLTQWKHFVYLCRLNCKSKKTLIF